MFEKEAEEYSNNWKINKNNDLNFAELVELRAVIYKANKDGAEFGFQKGIKTKVNTTTISDCPVKDAYVKSIIQDLLYNSDEYARQRAMDFLKGE